MERRIKWGVIGSGGIAARRTIPEGIARAGNAHLTAVYDIDQAVNNSIARAYNAHAAKSLEELLKTDTEAVYIASPANYHLEHITACANAGKHVLCEKPLGISYQEAESIINVCRENDIILGTALMMRFSSQHKAAMKLIRDGRLGKPVFARAQLSCWYPPIEKAWRQDPATGGGGALIDMGSHCLDLLEMFYGKIKSVCCFVNNTVHDYKSEDNAVVSVLFENGALGTVDTSFCIPDKCSRNVLELYGSKGSILAKGTIGQGASGEMLAFLEKEGSGYDADQARDTLEGIMVSPVPVNTYLAEIEEFSNALLENREPENNAFLGLRNQEIVTACYLSASTGKVIDV